MISKDQYIASLTKELAIIKHLAEKIKPEQLTHQPTEKQRTMQELMHYLSYIFIAGADTVASGDADAYKKYVTAPVPTLENFSEMMNDEEQKVMTLITPLSEESMKEEIAMWGRTQSRAMHLLGLLNMAVAYKMQLFLYMKQSGTSEINTMNLWAGWINHRKCNKIQHKSPALRAGLFVSLRYFIFGILPASVYLES